MRRFIRILVLVLRPFGPLADVWGWLNIVAWITAPATATAVALIATWQADLEPATAITGAFGLLVLLMLLSAFSAAYRVQGLLDEREEHTPTLEFGDPEEFPDEIIDGTPGKLWRVPLVNSRPNSRADNVKARLHMAEPNLTVLPVSLHEKHDNTFPFRQERNIRYGEPIDFDVVSQDLANENIFYLFRSDGDLKTPDHMMSEDDAIIVIAAAVSEGWRLTLRAVADPPTRGIEQRYLLFQSGTGPRGPVLSMRRDGDTRYL